MSFVNYEIKNSIAFVGINNPPVNALCQEVRAGIKESVEKANSDDSVKGIILYGMDKTFIAGADIKEFGKTPLEPFLPDVCKTIEQSKKPVVAGLHGTPLGGGLEVALSCHFRIANENSSMGLPEVTLGIIPGSGGTQRLPRIVGIKNATDIITTGKRISATKALEMGLIDKITTSDDIVKSATDYLQEIIEQDITCTPISQREIKDKLSNDDLNELRKIVIKKARGKNAPVKAFDTIVLSQSKTFDEALKIERETFLNLQKDIQSIALRYVFGSTRKVNKIPNIDKNNTSKNIKNVAVIGLGTMGVGIVMSFANMGFNVTCVEVNQDTLKAGFERIENQYSESLKRGAYTQQFIDDCINRITATTDLEKLKNVDLVIEAIFENMDVKKQIFTKVDKMVSNDTILATNTSYLDVNEIAQTVSNPQRFIGLHFFSPAHIMKLLEIVRPDNVSNDVLQTAVLLAKKLKKIGVISGVCDGFIGNRMMQSYFRQAEYIVQDGATPYQVDKSLTDFGFAMGIFSVGDLSGLDISYAFRRSQDSIRPNEMRYPGLADAVHDLGRLGRKTGHGWYNYTENPKGEPDDEIITLLDENRKQNNIKPKAFEDEEIIWRILCQLVNEGANILSENIAYRASDIDMVWVRGYGFPEYWGGPMFWADYVGLDKILDYANKQYETDPYNWKPSPLLQQLVSENKKFSDFDNQ